MAIWYAVYADWLSDDGVIQWHQCRICAVSVWYLQDAIKLSDIAGMHVRAHVCDFVCMHVCERARV